MQYYLASMVATSTGLLGLASCTGNRSGNMIMRYEGSTQQWTMLDSVANLELVPFYFEEAAAAYYEYDDNNSFVLVARGRIALRMDAPFSTSMVAYHVESNTIMFPKLPQPVRPLPTCGISRCILDQRACIVSMVWEAMMVVSLTARTCGVAVFVPTVIKDLISKFYLNHAMHIVTESDHYRLRLNVLMERLIELGYHLN